MSVILFAKVSIFHHNSKHLHYLSAFFTFVYISESFSLHVIFE